METLHLLSTLRTIANDTVLACKRQEFKSTFIFKLHNEKLRNISERVSKDSQFNRGKKAKYLKEINKMYLTGRSSSDYTLIINEVNSKVRLLTSAIDFMKR